ncbi:glutamyl-tRNA reductase [Sulfolobus acidocaldarius]|uniref:Glutamyl-tRNA reductase n=4 Tax=Sulfolobus acidocaldarius TaxID=2285 RepID=HEM1_SULAC|nr:glutamyl-tRNA reductase [Sulfolobus acidocaldarius]Q4JAM9.1 RecName: Full=Glutamyl-tRNA reductase; Short=GluTR [Sulfolobus acidocaldarius DSM 639]AAY80150.1 glutamyl-tRNA reductase [Sulfolobus acidocaldarius DSM 639]AGE70726.1 glutamyl-tRNA reductase [Sulfolobus acidocaldarius N8]AGE72998.1 glutamyl-tRNA reductase [Sulfolobus acidocaldarius Ron12/I]ALU28940.1 glutamyl-tRNA reductase [Sulfolobus acidocaldarius]ALU31666.1 glutamyl-tRNA reductase [Sulfolobus acidocaldarius]
MVDNIIDTDNYYAIVYTYKTIGLSKLYEHYIPEKDLINIRFSDTQVSLLQTCNRVELYLYTKDRNKINDILSKLNETHGKDISSNAIVLRGKDAINHLYQVASGLDSLAIGEYEILGQIKEALTSCKKHSLCNEEIELLFNAAIKVGRKVRSLTNISKGKVGIYSIAIQKSLEVMGDLTDIKIAIVGAGEIGSKLAFMLKNNGARNLTIFNRNLDRALELSNKFGYNAELLDFQKVNEYDLVFIAINNSNPSQLRLDKPKLVIDLSVPPVVYKTSNVIYLDDLRVISDNIILNKREDIKKAEAIINEEIQKFESLLNNYNMNRLVSRFMSEIEWVREKEVDRAFNEILKNYADKDNIKEIIDKMTYSLIKKVFSPILEDLRKDPNNKKQIVEYLIEVFQNGQFSDTKTQKIEKQ